MKSPSYLHLLYLCVLTSITGFIPAHAAEPTSIEDLHWMTGAWTGKMGNNELEETWAAPKGKTLAALVRMTTATGTEMIELIAIKEENNTLMLRLLQFDSNLQPRFDPAQALRMSDITDNSVTFDAHTAGGLKQIMYTRIDDSHFNIQVTLTEGAQFTVPMQAQTQ